MTSLIRPSTATVAALYTHFIIFVIVAVVNFTALDNTLSSRLGYGAALCLLSLISLLLSLTSQDPDDGLLRSLLMSLDAMWTSLGVYHVVQSLADNPASQSEALFSGYLAFLVIFIFFIAGSLHHKDKISATLALGLSLSCIFEIAALWKPVRKSAAAYYLLLAAITLYLVISKLMAKFQGRVQKTKIATYEIAAEKSKDYIAVAHAMNVAAAASFAGQSTGIYDNVITAFSWVVVAGLYQLILGVVAVRRSHGYNSMYFFFHGLFWFMNGFNLAVEFVTNETVPYLTAATVIHFLIFAVIAGVSLTRELFQVLQNLVVCILCVSILVDVESQSFVSVMGWILFIFALYTLAAHISRVQNSGKKLPLGVRILGVQQLSDAIIHSCKFLEKRANRSKTSTENRGSSLFSIDFTLGYSRYGNFDFAGFAINAVAALTLVWTPEGVWILPWSVVFGGVSSMIIGSLCFARGLTFESCAFFLFGSLWMIWGPARGLGNLDQDNSLAIITGCVGFLAVGLLLLGLSSVISKAWSAVMFFFNLIVIGILLNAVNANGAFIYEIVISILFATVCMYCFLAFGFKSVWGREVLPLGRPLLQVSYLHSQGQKAFWADGRKASGVRAIADIMNRGGICGVPTDVVYILVAALKFPAAVERAYNTKKLAEDRPMSMWISKVEQIKEGRDLFGEMVWGLMNEIWPSTVSLVVPKGEWYANLGVGASGKFVGRPDSIAVRMPNNTVTSHLIDQTGPVAVSSANPTGEADTTHHLQVLAKLGLENVDGILCSGPSPENMASTVVDCRNLNEGKIGFFRIGVVPRSHVEAVVAKVNAYHNGTVLPSISRNLPHGGCPHANEAFQEDEENIGGKDNAATNNSSHTKNNECNHNDNDNSGLSNSVDAGSSRNSTNPSFAEPRVEDSANRVAESTGPATDSGIEGLDRNNYTKDRSNSGSGISGHSNNVYESLAVAPQCNGFINGVVNKIRPFSGNAMPDILDTDSTTNPYEPMQAKRPGSAVDLISSKKLIGGQSFTKEPEFKVNPLFQDLKLGKE